MNLKKYNPFPAYVWSVMFIAFVAGYFVGNVVQSFAIENNKQNTCKFLHRYMTP